MIDHHSYTHNLSSCEIKAWKNFRLIGIQTHDLCHTGALLYQLSFRANWELVTLWVCYILVDGEDTSEYMKKKM